jgi:hypothetical protein
VFVVLFVVFSYWGVLFLFGGFILLGGFTLLGGFVYIGGFLLLLGGGMRNFSVEKLHAQFAYYKSPELGLNLSGS